MEIYQLRSFLAVARLSNLTRAADQLHLTQSAVSKQIKALEVELGVLLFDRRPGGMLLTAAGKLLLTPAEKTLTCAIELKNHASALSGGVAGTIRLATIIDPDSTRLGQFLGNLLQYYPLIQVKLRHGISGWAMERLVAGDVDAGFYLGKVTQSGIAQLRLTTVTYRVVAPLAWAEQMQSATWETIGTLPWVGTPVHSSQFRLVREMMAEHGHEPRIVVEADQESSMISLVSSGVGLCLMREDLAQRAATEGELAVWDGIRQPCPLSFIYPDSQSDNPMLQAMLRVLRETWGS